MPDYSHFVEPNPFEAPAAPLNPLPTGEAIDDAELIRRSYLRHESEIRSVGLLSYLAGAPLVLGALVMGLAAFGLVPMTTRGVAADQVGMFTAVAAVFVAMFAALAIGVGAGLRRLRPWARWTTLVLVGISFLSYVGRYVLALTGRTHFVDRPGQVVGNTIAALISGYIVYLMASRRSGMVFSREYRAVVRQTPDIRPYLSPFVKLAIGVLIGLGGLVGLLVSLSVR